MQEYFQASSLLLLYYFTISSWNSTYSRFPIVLYLFYESITQPWNFKYFIFECLSKKIDKNITLELIGMVSILKTSGTLHTKWWSSLWTLTQSYANIQFFGDTGESWHSFWEQARETWIIPFIAAWEPHLIPKIFNFILTFVRVK